MSHRWRLTRSHALTEEFYGPEYAHFKTVNEKHIKKRTLESILEETPERRKSIIAGMKVCDDSADVMDENNEKLRVMSDETPVVSTHVVQEYLIMLTNKSTIVLAHNFVHLPLLNYLKYAGYNDRVELIQYLRDHLPQYVFNCYTPNNHNNSLSLSHSHVTRFLHTREGSKVAMLCLGNGSAKDRKVSST